jgi:hypothetical protein
LFCVSDVEDTSDYFWEAIKRLDATDLLRDVYLSIARIDKIQHQIRHNSMPATSIHHSRTDPAFVEQLFFSTYSKTNYEMHGGVIGSRQVGGGLPVFEGDYYYQQRGDGFLSFLGTAARKLLPVFLKTGLTAAGAFVQSRQSGRTVKESLLDSVRPAASEAIRSGFEEIERHNADGGFQNGGSRRKKRTRETHRGSSGHKLYKRAKKSWKIASKKKNTNDFTHFNF